MSWTRKNADTTDEQTVTIGAIVSDVFLAKMNDLFTIDYFINSSLKTICKWCLQYYKEYEQAPKNHIQDIFDEKKFVIDKAEAQLIEEFLTLLSRRYTDFEEPVNDDYFLNRAKEYFTKRELIIRTDRVKNFLELDQVKEAEEEIENHKKFTILTSPAVNPFSEEVVRESLKAKDIPFFKLPGEAGELVGPIERGYLVGILGMFKRGKSHLLLNIATLAAANKMKVAIFSLEMQDRKVVEKLLRNVGTLTKEKDRLFPCFDCYKNQTGSCVEPERTNEVALITQSRKPKYDEAPVNYKPCTYCRTNNPKKYAVEYWFEFIDYPDITVSNARKAANSFTLMYGSNIRVVTYPRFTANIKDIERDLYLLEEQEMFIPDLIIIDYAGILKPEDPRENRIIQIDTTWKRLAQLASERNCVVVTATQGTRGAIKKKNTDSTDVAEWIGILGHVDIMLTLNQTPIEKENKVLRLGVLAHRHEDFNQNQNALLLTNFGAAQMFGDSYVVNVGYDE